MPPTLSVGLPPEKVAELCKLRDEIGAKVGAKVGAHEAANVGVAPWIAELEAIFAALNTILADVAPLIPAVAAPVAKP